VVVAMVVAIDVEACVRCGTCVEECPAAAISLDDVPVVCARTASTVAPVSTSAHLEQSR
jgi:ferredoxin